MLTELSLLFCETSGQSQSLIYRQEAMKNRSNDAMEYLAVFLGTVLNISCSGVVLNRGREGFYRQVMQGSIVLSHQRLYETPLRRFSDS